jgi:hypothetical protein
MISIVSIMMIVGVVSIVSTIVPTAIEITISIAFTEVGSLVEMSSVVLAIVELPLTVFLLPYVVVQSNRLV